MLRSIDLDTLQCRIQHNRGKDGQVCSHAKDPPQRNILYPKQWGVKATDIEVGTLQFRIHYTLGKDISTCCCPKDHLHMSIWCPKEY